MIKKLIIFLILCMPLASCTTVSELNEKIKGDGVPYIPGI